jgi:hypothetical protein
MCGALLLPAGSNATEPQRLLHNPFSRPPSIATVAEHRLLRNADSAQTLHLRATMVSSEDRLANVAGKILRQGDEVQGFTLLRIFEDHAIFVRSGSRVTVFVNPGLAQDVE